VLPRPGGARRGCPADDRQTEVIVTDTAMSGPHGGHAGWLQLRSIPGSPHRQSVLIPASASLRPTQLLWSRGHCYTGRAPVAGPRPGRLLAVGGFSEGRARAGRRRSGRGAGSGWPRCARSARRGSRSGWTRWRKPRGRWPRGARCAGTRVCGDIRAKPGAHPSYRSDGFTQLTTTQPGCNLMVDTTVNHCKASRGEPNAENTSDAWPAAGHDERRRPRFGGTWPA